MSFNGLQALESKRLVEIPGSIRFSVIFAHLIYLPLGKQANTLVEFS